MISLMLLGSSAFSQLHVGVFGGLSAYQGDLTDKIFPKKTTNGAIGISLNYELTEQIMLRGQFLYTIIGGADRFSDDSALIRRNLSFETSLVEFSAMGEYYFMNLYDRKFSPYLFAGLAVYHYNPYAFNGTTTKVFLQPLSTEGQGLTGYSGKPYSLTQFAIPFGGGIKYAFSEKLRLGLEFGLRKLFTDYLDDVSTNYADPADLLAARGQTAVDLSYRGDEVPGGDPNYPVKGAQRGGADSKDWYYTFGLHLTYRFGSGDGGGFMGGGKKKFGCPSVPQ